MYFLSHGHVLISSKSMVVFYALVLLSHMYHNEGL